MGLLDTLVDSTARRVQNDLTWKAQNKISKSATDTVDKLTGKDKQRQCPKCKAKVDPDAKFCPKCGQPLAVTCSKCNISYPLDTQFCKQCGQKLESKQ